MDNQNRPASSESSPAQKSAATASGKHVSRNKPSSSAGVRIRYSRLSSNSRFRRSRSPFIRLLNGLVRLWPFFAGGAALIIIVTLMFAMLSTSGDKTADSVPAVAVSATEIPEQTLDPTPSASPESTGTPEPANTPEPTAEPEPEVDTDALTPLSELATVIPSVTMSPEYKILKGIPDTDRALGLPECEMVDHSYFNDTVFIGDSVSEKLHLFVTKMRKTYPELLGNAKFITTPSLSSRNALKPVSDTSLHPTIRGKKMTIEDAVALSGAKKVYVMLGMNDVGISGVNKSAQNLMTLLRKIKDKSPDIQIFVQSATPRMKGDKPTTAQLFKYNLKVYEYCLKYTDYGMYFVDVAHVMRNKYGNLTASYCSDPDSMAIHFTDKACKEWIKYLYTHALV